MVRLSGAFVKSLVGDAQFAGQLLARVQHRSAVEKDGIFAPLDVERRIATYGHLSVVLEPLYLLDLLTAAEFPFSS